MRVWVDMLHLKTRNIMLHFYLFSR